MDDNTMTAAAVQSIELQATVVRCGCTPAQKAEPDWHGRRGDICPRPLLLEALGTVAYTHRNPLRRWAWRLGQWLSGRRPGRITMSERIP